jgi:hypothetical protein
MPLINATWKVTHAGVVLLDWTDFSDGEPRVERAFVNDRVAVLHGGSIANLGRQNVSHTASFTQVRFFENDDEARTYEREHTVSLYDAPADCLIEWLRTGLSDTLVDAVITGYRARVEIDRMLAFRDHLRTELLHPLGNQLQLGFGCGKRHHGERGHFLHFSGDRGGIAREHPPAIIVVGAGGEFFLVRVADPADVVGD